jgi:3-isopropylmalate/(R)-2-methylmalate dehydratase small subunit
MRPFTTLRSIAVPIDIHNCDTDQIIPARFLTEARTDENLRRFLFHDLRFNDDGSKTNFVLNQSPYRGAGILVADQNWGCGSSREEAATVLVASDIRVVIAPSIGDIHFNNCRQNGVLPAIASAADCKRLRIALNESPGTQLTVDLDAQLITGPGNQSCTFTIDALSKYRLLHGLDDISQTEHHAAEIATFRKRYRADYEWL